MVERIYKFDTVTETGGCIPYNVARLYTASGECIRIAFDEEGIKLYIPAECKDNGDIIFLKTMPEVLGIREG